MILARYDVLGRYQLFWKNFSENKNVVNKEKRKYWLSSEK